MASDQRPTATTFDGVEVGEGDVVWKANLVTSVVKEVRLIQGEPWLHFGWLGVNPSSAMARMVYSSRLAALTAALARAEAEVVRLKCAISEEIERG